MIEDVRESENLENAIWCGQDAGDAHMVMPRDFQDRLRLHVMSTHTSVDDLRL